MDNREYAQLFLTESREHVAAVNQSLLQLERDSTGPGAASAVGEIFRAVHTIKGMAATMGYSPVADLAHELETVLDCVRRGELSIETTIMDTLFRSADVLEQAVEAAVAGREGETVPPDLIAALRALTAAPGAAPVAPPSASPPPSETSGKIGELVRISLQPETPLRGVRAFLIVQALATLGEIVSTAPAIAALQNEDFDNEFSVRLVTSQPAAEIERVARAVGDVLDVQIGEPRASGAWAAPTPAWGMPALTMTPAHDMAALSAMTLTPAQGIPAAPSGDARSETGRVRSVRIDVRRLDALMNLIGELVIARGRLTQLATELGDLPLEETVMQSSRLITELRDEITASRMVPVSQVFDRFPRVVRDAARAVGKPVEFVIEGKDIELDRSMLDEIADSLVHLLRNAVDHGIEPADARAAAGKPAVGRLVLSAVRDRSAVVIKVSDDGKGIDRERVLERAKRDGLVDAAKTDLTEDELLRLLARPGFSTAEKVTGLSGRGVGVDAVYTKVRALGGAMDIRSVPGQGTTVLIRLPLTLAIMRALLARVGGETYAIPLAHVSETVELVPDVLRTVKGKEVLLARDEVLPLLRLRSLVGLPAYTAATEIDLEHVVVIDLGDRRAGLVIDELTGQEEIVVKQYDAVRDGPPFFGGATLLGDGRPSLIVDVSSLL
ncbi:MAG TPA: chemotaxis protein CheA [Gemmatimonadaceae bacterium]|nr:chemotaxis protein CheA [Gemmatimonadaceae bacterium]